MASLFSFLSSSSTIKSQLYTRESHIYIKLKETGRVPMKVMHAIQSVTPGHKQSTINSTPLSWQPPSSCFLSLASALYLSIYLSLAEFSSRSSFSFVFHLLSKRKIASKTGCNADDDHGSSNADDGLVALTTTKLTTSKTTTIKGTKETKG